MTEHRWIYLVVPLVSVQFLAFENLHIVPGEARDIAWLSARTPSGASMRKINEVLLTGITARDFVHGRLDQPNQRNRGG